jgi:hypothetical protein
MPWGHPHVVRRWSPRGGGHGGVPSTQWSRAAAARGEARRAMPGTALRSLDRRLRRGEGRASGSSRGRGPRDHRLRGTTVEPGFRWIKNPAAVSPTWLEKPEWIAALVTVTVVGLLVYTLIQRQVWQYLQLHHQHMPGNKGETALPTATVVLTAFSQVNLVALQLDDTFVRYTRMMTCGTYRHPLRIWRKNVLAACLSRRHCTRISSMAPS